MNLITPRNTRLSAAVLAGAILATSLSSTAAMAAPTVAPATSVAVTQQATTVDHDPITDPYTGHLADRVLGSDLVAPEPTSGLDRTNPRLIELQKALVNGTLAYDGVYSLNNGAVKWSKLSGTTKLIVLRNTTSSWESVIVPTTGAKVLMAPYSGDIVSGVAAALNPYIPVQGAIATAYLKGGGADVFGIPTTAEVAVAGGTKQSFSKGAVFYWSSATGAHPVKGAIGAKFNGNVAGLGFPTKAEQKLASGGSWQPFQKGRIYWKSTTGAHVVDNGDIGKKYVALGGSTSALGYPTSSKIKLSNSEYIQYFEYGLIAWKDGKITVSTATKVVTR